MEAAYEEAVAVGGVVGVEDELRLVNVRELGDGGRRRSLDWRWNELKRMKERWQC